MLIDGKPVKVGDLVHGEPPRGATTVDRDGTQWRRLDVPWGHAWHAPGVSHVLQWAELRDGHGPMRLSR